MDVAGSAHPRRLPRKSAVLAAVLGWILPGLGQAYVGRVGKGLFFFTVVLATYAAGLLLADFRCVNVDREPVWFAAEALAAGPTAAVAWLTRNLEVVRRIATYDAGILYCAVAALLNAVVVADALGTVDDIDREASAVEEAERAQEEARIAAETQARIAAEEAARAAASEELAPAVGSEGEAASADAFPAAGSPSIGEASPGIGEAARGAGSGDSPLARGDEGEPFA